MSFMCSKWMAILVIISECGMSALQTYEPKKEIPDLGLNGKEPVSFQLQFNIIGVSVKVMEKL